MSQNRSPEEAADSVRQTVTITNQKGLHARASSKFVACAEQFDCELTVTRGNQSVDGYSILDLMMLAAGPGSEIILDASGQDAVIAIETLTALIEAGFGED